MEDKDIAKLIAADKGKLASVLAGGGVGVAVAVVVPVGGAAAAPVAEDPG